MSFQLAGVDGIKPPSRGSKSRVLSLDDTPIKYSASLLALDIHLVILCSLY